MRCECPKEQTSQSSLSPGLVKDNEPIVYVLVHPETSSVKPISKSGLKASTLSVVRGAYITGQEAKSKTVAVLLEKNNQRIVEGFVWATCGEIRRITLGVSKIGAFCVIDDALEGYHAHAHLGYSEPKDAKLKNDREAARGNLLLLFKENGISNIWHGSPFCKE